MINKMLTWLKTTLTGRPTPTGVATAIALGLCLSWLLALTLRAMVAYWPEVVIAALVGLIALRRRAGRRAVEEQRVRDAWLDRYIASSLTDEALRWAVGAWSRRYGTPPGSSDGAGGPR